MNGATPLLSHMTSRCVDGMLNRTEDKLTLTLQVSANAVLKQI
jgi:hypothetical protein